MGAIDRSIFAGNWIGATQQPAVFASGSGHTVEWTSDAGSIDPSITLSSGAPTPTWTVIESDGTTDTYNTASFSHTNNAGGDMCIRLSRNVYDYVTHIDLSDNGLKGTFTTRDVQQFRNLQVLRLHSNSALDCNFALADLPASMTHLYLHSTSSTITGALADLPASKTILYLYNTSSTITGALADLPASMTRLYLYSTSSTITGALGDLPASMTRLYLHNTSSTITGGASAISATDIQDVRLEGTGMVQADVDDVVERLYTDRASFTDATPNLNIGGSNASPSGTYQDGDPPTTGKEYIYEIVNDPESEGFNTWTVTYTS